MPTRVSFGPAEVQSGKNKGQPRTLKFSTGIDKANANGLPIENGNVLVEISAAAPQVIEFANADEVRAAAGSHLETFLVTAANAAAKAAARSKLTTEFRKLSLPPSDPAVFVTDLCNSITAESLFEPTVRSGRVGIKQELTQLTTAAESMSKEDLLAAIAALIK